MENPDYNEAFIYRLSRTFYSQALAT